MQHKFEHQHTILIYYTAYRYFAYGMHLFYWKNFVFPGLAVLGLGKAKAGKKGKPRVLWLQGSAVLGFWWKAAALDRSDSLQKQSFESL